MLTRSLPPLLTLAPHAFLIFSLSPSSLHLEPHKILLIIENSRERATTLAAADNMRLSMQAVRWWQDRVPQAGIEDQVIFFNNQRVPG